MYSITDHFQMNNKHNEGFWTLHENGKKQGARRTVASHQVFTMVIFITVW